MSLYKTVKSILYLAIPTIIGNIGIILMVVVDTIMVSQYSAKELTYRSSANILHFFLITVLAGFTQGIGIVSANFFGKKYYYENGRLIIKSAFPLLIIGIIGTLIYYYGQYMLLFFKQDPEIVKFTDPILKILGIGFIPCTFYFVFAYFLESINKPIPVVIAVIISNIMNLILNWVFIFGHFGLPAMGAIGSAISSTIVQFLAPAIMLVYIICMHDNKKFFNKNINIHYHEKNNYFFIGLGVAIVLGLEEIGYAANLIYAGWISDMALASYSVLMNIFMVCMTITMGLAEATSILVGIQNGKKDINGIKMITTTSLLINIIIMLLIASILYLNSNVIPKLYSNNQLIINIINPLIYILALVLIIDSSQVILSHAIRGTKIVVIPTSIQTIATLFIMLPFSWFFAISLKMGVLGLLIGIISSSFFTFIILAISFYFLIKFFSKKYDNTTPYSQYK